jgi:hypothetical protein
LLAIEGILLQSLHEAVIFSMSQELCDISSERSNFGIVSPTMRRPKEDYTVCSFVDLRETVSESGMN